MSAKKLLTKEIAEQYLEDENSVAFDDFTEIEDAAALVLGARKTSRWDSLVLWGLTSLSSTAAKSLSAFKGTLYLSGLTSLSDGVAESLSGHEAELHLGGLVSMSDSTAEILAKHKGELHLSGLKMVSEKATDSLIKCKGTLHLDALKELKKFSYPVTRLLQVCLTKAGSGWGEAPPSQKHVSTAIPPEGKFAEEPGEWQNGTILIEEASTLFKWRTYYLGNPEKGNIDYKVAVRWHWSDFRGDQRKARKWFFEKLSDEHSKKTSSSRVRYVISPEAFSLWLGHEGFWIAQSLHELDQAKAEAKKRAAAFAPQVSVSKQKDSEPPSEKVLSAKEAGKLRKLIKTKELSKIRFVCETLDTLDATQDDWAKLFPKTRIKELVKHACDERKMETLDTLAGAFEALPELFDKLQTECQDQFKKNYWGNLPLPKNHAWARIVASTGLLNGLKSVGDDEISLFLTEAIAAKLSDWSGELNNLETMTEKAAKIIVAKAERLSFGDCFKITPEIAKILAKFKGELNFQLSEIPDEIAGCLAKYKGDRLVLDYRFKWKDEPGHLKLARTIAKTKNGSYKSFEKTNSQPLNILKEFVHENAHLSFDFEDKTINGEKLAFLAHECFAGSEITLSSFRVDLKTARELSKCKAAKMKLQFWTNKKTGLLGGSGTGKKDPDLSKEKAVIDTILPYEGELQLGFLHYGGMGVDKAQRAFDLLIESKLDERKESLQKKIKQKSLSSASLPADVDQVEAERKIERLKDVLCSEEAGELGLTLLAAADPWMIEMISADMEVSDDKIITNDFLDSENDDSDHRFWPTIQRRSPQIHFWLVYARAIELGFHLKFLKPVKDVTLVLETEEALRITTEEILPRLPFIERLCLSFTEQAGSFCTDSFPTLSKLRDIFIDAKKINTPLKNEITLADLAKQKSLIHIELDQPNSVLIEDPKPFLSNIRLELTTESLHKINRSTLEIILFNKANHSKSKKPPQWWKSCWKYEPLVADIFGGFQGRNRNGQEVKLHDFNTSKEKTYRIPPPADQQQELVQISPTGKISDWVFPGQYLTLPPNKQVLDLSNIESFSSEMVELIVGSKIPVRLNGNLLSKELFSLLCARKEPFELILETPDLLYDVEQFSANELIIYLTDNLSEKMAKGLAHFQFPVQLICQNIEIKESVASILAQREKPTKFSFNGDLCMYGLGNPDHLRISKPVLDILLQNQKFDLGLFAPTMMVKEKRYMNLSIYQEPGKEKMTLETLSGVDGGSSRVSTKPGNIYDKKKKIVEQLLKGYQFA